MACDSQDCDELEQLLERSKIHMVLVRYARGIDRRDPALVRSCFHEDAIEEHGTYSGRAVDFVEFVMPRLQHFEMTSHNLCNVWIEIKGSTAVAETYFLALHVYVREADVPKPDLFLAGRYVDRFEKRGRQWKIAHRQLICDYVREFETEIPRGSGLDLTRMMQQRAGTDDYVYRRWAELDDTPIDTEEGCNDR